MAETHSEALRHIESMALKHHLFEDFATAVVNHLNGAIPHYSWVGIYLVEGNELVLGAWKGPAATEHTRIPIGKGVCGAAAASGKTEVVDDVATDSRYLACFLTTQSEIVVPIRRPRSAEVVGEIDIDSDRPAAFTPEDRKFLETVADLLGDKIS